MTFPANRPMETLGEEKRHSASGLALIEPIPVVSVDHAVCESSSAMDVLPSRRNSHPFRPAVSA